MPNHRPTTAEEAARVPFARRLREGFAHAPGALRLVWKSSPRSFIALAALTLAGAVTPIGVAWVGKAIVDAVVARSTEQALRWVLIELGLVLTLALTQRGLALVRTVLGARLSIDINALILTKALTLELVHFEDPEFYDQLTRARREASSRPLSMVTGLFQLAQNILTFAGYAALLMAFSPWAMLVLVVAATPATIAEMRFSTVAFRLRNRRSPEARKLSYIEYVLSNDEHAKEIKLLGLGPMLLARYRSLAESFYEMDRDLAVGRAGWGYGLSVIGTLTFYGLYAFMALAAAAGRLTLGNLTLYTVAFRQGQQSFQSILSAISAMYEDNLYMSNLFAFLNIDVHKAGARATVSLPPAKQEAGLRFEDVGFRYPGKELWAIEGINLFIPAGQSLALVGHNGAGKTTLIKLLTRLYEPTTGRILLDGRDLGSIPDEELRSRLGVIFQDYNQYQLDLRENVGVGSVDHLEDPERIERALHRGGAEGLLAELPEGLDTPLGRWFRDGVELSGGQWQKVALSRAFMRQEADILILDEPTAALDADAEHAVFERFRELAAGRTTIVISHRFPTVRMADRILVLEGGRIIEQGTHDELVAASGQYARMFALQAEGYS